jgi:hypothetical protein
MPSYPFMRCAGGLIVALAIVTQPAIAQATPAAPSAVPIDTTGVLDALATVVRVGPAESWFVAPGDSLTARLAALARVATAPTPAGAVCGFDALPGATVALTTALALYPVSPDTVYATVSHSCGRTRRSAVGSRFSQAERYRVVRRERVWTAKLSGRSIT